MARRLGLAALLGMSLLATIVLASDVRADVWHRPSPEQRREIENDALEVLGAVALDTATSEPTRLNAVGALLDYGDADAVPLLAEILLSTPTPTVRRAAADGLWRFRSLEAAAALRTAAERDPIARIRWRAGLALARQDPTRTEVIRDLLSKSSTLAAAAIDLQQPTADVLLPDPARPIARRAFREALQDGNSFNEVQRAALVKALGRLNDAAAVPLIRDVLTDASENAFIRGSAAFALGLLEARGAVPALLDALEADDAGLQSAAAGALGRIGSPEAQAPLQWSLKNSGSAEVRAASAEALGAYGADVLPLLEDALDDDPSLAVREAALGSLTAIGGTEATRAVVDFAQSGFLQTCDPMSCGSLVFGTLEALVALGRAEAAVDGFQAALDGLRPQLPLVFAFSSDALIEVATVILDAQPEALSLFTEDESAFAQAIGLFAWADVADGPEARRVFKQFVDAAQPTLVRRAAMEGLVQWALPRDIPIFLEGVSSEDTRTRTAAYAGLARVGDERALAAFQQGLNSESATARIQAAGAAMGWANRSEARDRFQVPLF